MVCKRKGNLKRPYEGGVFFKIFTVTMSLESFDQKGPVTMIVPASGHQVRCIPWVQMAHLTKRSAFYVD